MFNLKLFYFSKKIIFLSNITKLSLKKLFIYNCRFFCFHFNSKLYPVIHMLDVFPLRSWSGSLAIWYTSYHIQNRSFPTALRYENHAKNSMFQWKQKTYSIWKLERNNIDPAWCNHSTSMYITRRIEYSNLHTHKKKQTFGFLKKNSYTNVCLKLLCDKNLTKSLIIF